MSDPFRSLTAFFAELKRRRVYRVGAVYIAVAFLLLEGVDLVAESLGLPPVVMTTLVVIALFGFPLALVLAWALESTPEGVRRTEPLAAEARGSAPAPSRGGAWVLLGLGIAVAAAAGWWLFGGEGDDAIDVSEIRSVAVLPLDNLSGDPGEEPFVAGMHDELINQLSRVGALLVKSRTSVLRYGADSLSSIPEIGRALGVDAILEGSVLRAGDEVRITVQLIHVPTDTHLWSESFDRELRDVLALHSDVARAVAREVHAVLTPEERQRLERTRELEPEALEHYVRGRYLWNQRTESGHREALEEFRAALDIDPTYAEAWAGIADVYAVPTAYGLAENPTARAVEAARRALAIDSTLAEAHTALAYGLLGQWEWRASERHFRRAIELNPSYATAHQWYAELLAAQNRMDEAVASARRATVRDPLSGIIAWNLARILYFARRPREALEQLRRGPGRSEEGSDLEIGLHIQLGQMDSAWADILGDPDIPPDIRTRLEQLREAGLAPDEAFARLPTRLPAGPSGAEPAAPLMRSARVLVPAVRGREEEALSALEAIAEPGAVGGLIVDLAADPRLDPIRDDPRYRAFLRKVGLARYWPADNGSR